MKIYKILPTDFFILCNGNILFFGLVYIG